MGADTDKVKKAATHPFCDIQPLFHIVCQRRGDPGGKEQRAAERGGARIDEGADLTEELRHYLRVGDSLVGTEIDEKPHKVEVNSVNQRAEAVELFAYQGEFVLADLGMRVVQGTGAVIAYARVICPELRILQPEFFHSHFAGR